MDKLRIIQHARSYMDLLSKGIDPISGESVPEDSTLQQDRLKKCFGFVTEILDEIIINDGIVSFSHSSCLTSDTNSATINPMHDSIPSTVNLTAQQRRQVTISSAPLLPSAFVKRINAVIDPQSSRKVSLVKINKWLLKNGYLAETKVPTVVNKSVKVITPLATTIGVMESLVVDKKTGEAKSQIFFSQDAQEFILQNINEIANS